MVVNHGCFLISDMFSCTLIIHVRFMSHFQAGFPGGAGASAPEGRKSLGGSSRVLKAPGPGPRAPELKTVGQLTDFGYFALENRTV